VAGRTPLSELVARIVAAPPVPLAEGWTGALRAGTLVGHFEILGELGRGGFGIVHEARDRRLGRLVAFKVVRPGPADEATLRAGWLAREAEAAARLDHPNIVVVHDVGTCDAGPYVVMERLHGETLRERLHRGPIPSAEALRIAVEIARGVAHAHAAGVVHRDLTPGNVFLRRDGSVKVLDFGLARMLGGGAPGPSGGTPDYMAPEQEAGEPGDARSDVFAMGTVLAEMLGPARAQGALGAIVERARAPDPAARYRDAREMLQALEERTGRTPARSRWRSAGIAAAIVAALGIGAWLLGRGTDGAERVGVAVADVENRTGDPELDGLSGLLATSLAQSPHLAVVPRARLLDAAGAAADGGTPERVDAVAAREHGRRAGASTVLAPEVEVDGKAIAIRLSAVTAGDGATLFTLRERAATKADVPAALDRLSRATRLALREREADVHASDIRLADAVTSSLLAYQHYAASQACMYRTSYGQDCSGHLEQALAADPTFALAHYQLAVWRAHHGGSREEQRVATEAASRHIARVPPKERRLIRAWVAHFDGRDEEALAELSRLVESNPADEEGIYEAGDLLFHRSEFERAAPWFERQLHLDPQLAHGWGLEHLAHSLGALGRTADLRRLADGWSAGPQSAANLHALVTALAWLGDLPGALEASRREVAAGATASGLQDQVYVSIMAGRFDELRETLAPLAEPGGLEAWFGGLALVAVDGYQGRRAAGRARLAALGDGGQDALVRGMRIQFLAGDPDPAPLLREVEALHAVDPEAAAVHAPLLAWLGHGAEAARLAPHLRDGTPRRRAYEALVLWQSGDRAEGLRRMREVARTSPVDVDFALAPAFLAADLAARSGADEDAVEGFRRFRAAYVPTAMWRSWAQPLSLVLEAEALARLGRPEEARDALARFDEQWREADADVPLVARADAVAERVGVAVPRGGG
jgi:eukaryotic-like serine/threonine-protein kinase